MDQGLLRDCLPFIVVALDLRFLLVTDINRGAWLHLRIGGLSLSLALALIQQVLDFGRLDGFGKLVVCALLVRKRLVYTPYWTYLRQLIVATCIVPWTFLHLFEYPLNLVGLYERHEVRLVVVANQSSVGVYQRTLGCLGLVTVELCLTHHGLWLIPVPRLLIDILLSEVVVQTFGPLRLIRWHVLNALWPIEAIINVSRLAIVIWN